MTREKTIRKIERALKRKKCYTYLQISDESGCNYRSVVEVMKIKRYKNSTEWKKHMINEDAKGIDKHRISEVRRSIKCCGKSYAGKPVKRHSPRTIKKYIEIERIDKDELHIRRKLLLIIYSEKLSPRIIITPDALSSKLGLEMKDRNKLLKYFDKRGLKPTMVATAPVYRPYDLKLSELIVSPSRKLQKDA